MEVWKNCKDHNSKYYVSNLGRVKGPSGKILKGCVKKGGYIQVAFSIARRNYKSYYIHVLVCHYFIYPKPLGYECDHIDSNPGNNNLSNLQYLTPKQNCAKKRPRPRKIPKKDRKVNCLCGNKIRDGKYHQMQHLKSKYHKNYMLNIRNEIKEASL